MFKLISDSEIKQAIEFAPRRRNRFKTATDSGEVSLSHEVNESDRIAAQAQLDSCEKQYQEKLQEIKNKFDYYVASCKEDVQNGTAEVERAAKRYEEDKRVYGEADRGELDSMRDGLRIAKAKLSLLESMRQSFWKELGL